MAPTSSKNHATRAGIQNPFLLGLISGLTALLLAISLVGVGLFMCCMPLTTEVLSSQFSKVDSSPFTKEELVEAAVATADYTVGTHDREKIYQVLSDINISALNDNRAQESEAPSLSPDSNPGIEELAYIFSLADESYVLTDDALTHLDDVYVVVNTARIVLLWMAILALAGCIVLGKFSGKRRLGVTLVASAGIVIAIFAILAIWVLVDFGGFFTVLHSLFFADGTWTFSVDSLLITMYPTEFWVGMGAVWLASTVLACLICFILGLLIKGKKKV